MGRVLDLLTGGRFDDFDFAEDDAFLGQRVLARRDDPRRARPRLGRAARGHPLGRDLGTSVAYSPGWDKRGAPVITAARVDDPLDRLASVAAPPRPDLWLVRDGRPADKGVTAVPGPLANLYLDYRGRTTVLASGRANHAGLGDPAVDAAIRNGTLRREERQVDDWRWWHAHRHRGRELRRPEAAAHPEQVRELVRLDRKIRDAYLGERRRITRWITRRSSDRKIDLITARRQVPPLNYLAA